LIGVLLALVGIVLALVTPADMYLRRKANARAGRIDALTHPQVPAQQPWVATGPIERTARGLERVVAAMGPWTLVRVRISAGIGAGAEYDARRREIIITRRLIDEAPDDVLRAILGHGLGHYENGDTQKARWPLAGLAGAMLGVGLAATALANTLAWSPAVELVFSTESAIAATVLYYVGVLLPHSRRVEFEADATSLRFVALADAVAWHRWSAAAWPSRTPRWLDSHPSDASRIAALEALPASVPPGG
jgi:Zn-dependent protease with chaperone function